METRANYIAVGIFTLLAVAVTLALVYWFGRYGDNENLVPLDVRIQGSVSGLGPGSTVQFNGITVGRVDGLSLDNQDPRFVIVHTRVNAATPIRKDTRANIGIRGLSGGAFIQLEGGTPNAPTILPVLGAEPRENDLSTPQINGDPAALADLLVRINAIAFRIEGTMKTLESFVSSNEDTVTRTLDNVETFSKALASNSDGVGRFMTSAGDVAVSLEQLSAKLDGSLQRAEEILTAVDPKRISNTVENIEAFSKSVADQREQIAKVVTAVDETTGKLNAFSDSLNKTIAKVDGVVEAVEPDKVRSAIANFDATGKKAAEVLATLDQQKISKVVDDLAATTESARGILGSIDQEALKTLVVDLGKASKSISQVVEVVKPEQVSSVIANIDASSKKANEVLAALDESKITKMVDDLSATSSGARSIVESIDGNSLKALVSDLSNASKNVSAVVAAVDAARINQAVDSISNAAQGAQTIVEDVRKVTKPLGEQGNDVGKIVSDAAELVARLNESSKKVDSVIDNVNNLFGSGVNNGLVADARRTLTEIRRASRILSGRISEVSRDVSSFTKRGLGDTQTLIRDARQSINRIDRVIRNLQDNPSSLITGAGGSRVRESGGRPRR